MNESLAAGTVLQSSPSKQDAGSRIRTSASTNSTSVDPLEAKRKLVKLIEAAIIPQLLSAARPAAPPRLRRHLADIAQHDIVEFTELLLADNKLAIASSLDLWRAKGVAVETIYLELLTGAARHLGLLWDDDECNFCEVGLGIWRIQQIMYDLRAAFFAEGAARTPSGYRVLLAPLALEQHTLGVMMMAEFFRRAGWDVSSELPTHNDMLLEAVRREHIDLIGISVADERVVAELSDVISAVRATSKNPRITVMVGGWLFAKDSARAVAMGADFAAPDLRDAVIRAEKFVALAWDKSESRQPLSPMTANT